MRMDTVWKQQWIDREAAGEIAKRELPQIPWEQIWILRAYSSEYGTPVYQIRAYGELTAYDIIIDAYQGTLLQRTESCPENLAKTYGGENNNGYVGAGEK